jgi:hypothetical protein
VLDHKSSIITSSGGDERVKTMKKKLSIYNINAVANGIISLISILTFKIHFNYLIILISF